MYKEEDLVAIAKRKNNTKRGYLVVNPLQGKHCPVSPKKVMDLFSALAQQLQGHYENDRILFIGFAETATAIGAGVALSHGGYYMQTTREEVENVTFFDFSESHSHATEQKLVKTDIDTILPKIDRIIFVEDEITTGNTILNIITLLRKTYQSPPPFSVLSFLNGMTQESLASYASQNIQVHYLLKTDHSTYEAKAQTFLGDGISHEINFPTKDSKKEYPLHECEEGYINSRRLCKTEEYALQCDLLWQFVKNTVFFQRGQTSQKGQTGQKSRILVLGTEEFMYPPLFVAKKLEEQGNQVFFHATTRSPIAVSLEKHYPLQESWHLPSFYTENRDTYLYNLKHYDNIFILTDSKQCNQRAIDCLVSALEERGNETIHIIRWK